MSARVEVGPSSYERAGSLRRRRQDALALGLLALVLVVAQGIYWVVGTPEAQGAAYVGSRVLSTAVFAYGVARTRPAFRGERRLLLAAMLLWLVGDVVVAVQAVRSVSLDSWSSTSLVGILSYLCLFAALVGMARREGIVAGAAVVLDVVLCAVSLSVVWWLLIGQQILLAPGGSDLRSLLVSSYPLCDVLAIAGAVAVLSARSAHEWCTRALALSAVVDVVADIWFGYFVVGLTDTWYWPAALWMVQSVLLAAAAVLSGRPVREPSSRVSRSGVLMMVGAVVAPMMTIAVQTMVGRAPATPSSVVLSLVGTAMMVVLVCVRVLILVRRLEKQANELEQTARTDELTQLPNRRAGMRLLHDSIGQVEQGRLAGLTVALLDLDHFKSFNDTHGHLQGDRLLRAAGLSWASVIGPGDMLFRYGGEEFVVIMPEGTVAGTRAVLLRMRRATPRGQTFSAGITSLRAGDTAEDVIGRADASLYAAKAAGRDRSCISA